MGIASRHAGAPYVDGETLSGSDLESDIANVYAEVNGNIENANIASAAAIAASKLASNDIKVLQLNSLALPDLIVQSLGSDTVTTGGGAKQNIFTSDTVTSQSTSDVIIVALNWECSDTSANQLLLGVTIGGSDYDRGYSPIVGAAGQVLTSIFAVTAPSVGGITIQPFYQENAGNSCTVHQNSLFLCMLLRQK